MDAKAINKFPIRDYLAARGIHPARDRGYYGLYHSPLREDHTPSMKVNYDKNLWIDYGTGEGGTLIDLVMQMERCDAGEAMRRLERHIGGMFVSSFIGKNPTSQRPHSIVVEKVRPLESLALLDYLTERSIDLAAARAHCSEVHYHVAGKSYFAVGFRNDAGGWELRSERFKGCVSPKHITTIDNRSDTVVAFEGFLDFLSYLSMKPDKWQHIDVAGLNSVVHLPKAIPFLERHAMIHAFFDNDEAGRKATADLKRLCPNSSVIDRSHLYRGHKDLNEYWQAKQHRQQSRPHIAPKCKRGMKM